MKPYYEGWYMKHQQGDDVLAVIPGRAQDSAFIQIITSSASHFVAYPLEDFRQDGIMRIGSSVFAQNGMDVDVRTPDVELVGRLRYRGHIPLRYDIMGPFALLPMETKHTVFSMRHRVEGSISLDGSVMRFTEGLGYMEGDRGCSFPRSYLWAQSMDFAEDASVMVAIAEIPLPGVRFTGCIAIVWLDGREYRLATYLGVHVLEASSTAVHLAQRGLDLRIELPEPQGRRLQAPQQGAMERSIHESPDVPARFRFAKDDRTLLESPCARTSFEIVSPEAAERTTSFA